jgi:hypothetical protein
MPYNADQWNALIDSLEPDKDEFGDEYIDSKLQALVDEYESGQHGEQFASTLKLCTYCMAEDDHFEKDCPIKDEDDAQTTYDEINEYLATVTSEKVQSEDSDDFEGVDGPRPLWLEDEDSGLQIPTDPLEPCFNAAGDELTCHCTSALLRTYTCYVCGLGRQSPTHAWRPYREDGEYDIMKRRNKHKKNKEQKSKKKYDNKLFKSAQPAKKSTAPAKPAGKPAGKSYAGGYGYDTGGYGFLGKDRHYGDTYTTYDGSLTYYVSSMWNSRKEGEFLPDWGLYFDWGWHPWWRAEHIDWPDYGVPSAWNVAIEQILTSIEKVQAGLKVEVGCIGAHGRTGTMLAVVNVILGCEPKAAINHVRTHHCEHAIESERQEWWVSWVHAQLTGTECPPMPEHKPKTYSTKVHGTNTVTNKDVACTELDHFDMWLWMPIGKDKVCPEKGDKCQFWKTDVSKFMNGRYPTQPIQATAPLYSKSEVVCGHLVPAPKYRETKHSMTAKQGCKCDVCRYIELGHGAFLRPCKKEEGAKWDKMMDGIEWDARRITANRKRLLSAATTQESEKTPEKVYSEPIIDSKKLILPGSHADQVTDLSKDPEVIKVAQSDGSILEVAVHHEFHKRHDTPTGTANDGERRNEFVYLDGQGWVWERLAKVNV